MSNQFLIDSHIHLDLYSLGEREKILNELEKYYIKALISVSYHLASSRLNLKLANRDARVKTAFGFHPEQLLPSEEELGDLLSFINEFETEMIAVGEVGLPYYKLQSDSSLSLTPYIELLEAFIIQAKKMNKPVILHAIYNQAQIVCDLLEKHSIKKAHFHWFKGDESTTQRIIENGYYVSITPDVLYEWEIEELVKEFSIEQIMVETDGPWAFKGPFTGSMTHPSMMHHTVRKIAKVKNIHEEIVYKTIFDNTCSFYGLLD